MSDNERAPLAVVKTPLRNRRKRAIRLRLEPWGEEYIVGPGQTVQVVARGPAGDTLEIEWSSEAVTVYGWPGSRVELLRRGIDLRAAFGRPDEGRLTAPFLPEGMRVREWLAAMAS